MSTFYDDSRYGVTKTVSLTCDAAANNDADAATAKFKFFTAGKITAANIVPTTAGQATTSGATIKLGTTSIGACVAGTGAVLTPVDGTVTVTSFSAGDSLAIHAIVATETGVFQVHVAYQEVYA